MCLHLVSLIIIYVLPRFIRGERSHQTNSVKLQVSNNVSSASATKKNAVQSNGMNSHEQTKMLPSNNAHNDEQFIDNVPINSNQCDINVKFTTDNNLEMDTAKGVNDASESVENDSTDATCKNSLSNVTYDYRQHNSTGQHLSKKIRERIDSETRNIEEFIDKTVTGIVELKDDLMRVDQDEMYATKLDGVGGTSDDGPRKRNLSGKNENEIETFLRKEISNGNVLIPAVLSNGHAD